MSYNEDQENIKKNIYHFLIDYQDMKSLAIETFENIDSLQQGYLTIKQIQMFVKTFLEKIHHPDLLSYV